MFEPVKRVTVSDQVYSQLRGKILGDEYKPGERLPSERKLSEEFGVNRSSVREAVKRLEQVRLVRVRQGEGIVVLDFRMHAGFEVLKDLLVAGGQINPIAVRSIFEFRSLIGPEIARLAALRIQSADLEALEEIVEAIEAEEGASEFQLLDFDFHHMLARASQNLALLLILNSAKEIYHTQFHFFSDIFRKVSKSERRIYREILEVMRAKDSDRAFELTGMLIEEGNNRFWEQWGAAQRDAGSVGGEHG